MAHSKRVVDALVKELREFGLTYPDSHTKSPWPEHLDLAVKDKTFAFLTPEGSPFQISCKLPHSSFAALSLPFVTPTGYGLGKSGWVTAQLPAGDLPVALFKAWIDESYRAQAPKRCVKALETQAFGAAGDPARKKATRDAGGPAARKKGTRDAGGPPARKKATRDAGGPPARKKATRDAGGPPARKKVSTKR